MQHFLPLALAFQKTFFKSWALFRTALSQAEQCPGQRSVKLIAVLDSAEYIWALDSKQDKLIDVLNKTSWEISRIALNEAWALSDTSLFPLNSHNYCNKAETLTECCPGQGEKITFIFANSQFVFKGFLFVNKEARWVWMMKKLNLEYI